MKMGNAIKAAVPLFLVLLVTGCMATGGAKMPSSRQARIEIRPGMHEQAELQTGAKSVLQYLLKPLYKSKDALRER
jgi:hypothetical protein